MKNPTELAKPESIANLCVYNSQLESRKPLRKCGKRTEVKILKKTKKCLTAKNALKITFGIFSTIY